MTKTKKRRLVYIGIATLGVVIIPPMPYLGIPIFMIGFGFWLHEALGGKR